VAQQTVVAGDTFRWNPEQIPGTALELTFSFMPETSVQGQRPFSDAEQAVVRQVLALVASMTLLTFREVAETVSLVGQLRFTVTQQASSKGYTALPNAKTNSGAAGDIYMDVESMLDLTPGSQGMEALLHEIGHALGLRHPVNVGSDDKWSIQAASKFNTTQHTVMAPTAESLGLSRSNWGPLDVAALRYLYGTRPNQAGDTTIILGDSNGVSLHTLVDDGGMDTLDCSGLSLGVQIDLNPGSSSSVGRDPLGLQVVGNLSLGTDTVIENLIGTSLDDVLIGNDEDNTIWPLAGNDWIEGGPGRDKVVLSKEAAAYTLSFDGLRINLAAIDGESGFKTLAAVESLAFVDRQVEIASKAHTSYADLPDSLYQFFVVGFGAAAGVTYMDQMAEAYRFWLPTHGQDTVAKIVEAFTTKTQFTSEYPQALYREEKGKYFVFDHDLSQPGQPMVRGAEVVRAVFEQQMGSLATGLVEQIVKGSATAQAKTDAARDLHSALSLGGPWTIGKVIYTVFGNLAAKPYADAVWGGTAKQFANQVAVAKYYTDVLSQSTADVTTLRSVVKLVTDMTEVSSADAIVKLIGVALIGGPPGG
jgi:serralysin